MRQITVELGQRSYPIHIGSGSLNSLGELCREHLPSNRVAVVSDKTVSNLYASNALESLRNRGIDAKLYSVDDGEESKSLQVADSLYERLLQDRYDRSSTVIALGGGVVGDLAGFVAATFMRGVAYVQVPTTLLAQVDSSVGGKVGINHRLGKNLIGAFHQPKFVLIDPNVLGTLPGREIRAGAAEVIKYGLIQDQSFFEFLEANLPTIMELKDPAVIEQAIETCCCIKADVVQNDERETGLRRILNFGHTIGHALEAVTGYGCFRHGEAVLLGMRGATWVSLRRGLLSSTAYRRAEELLAAVELDVPLPNVEPGELLSKMKVDKKIADEKLHFVLLAGLGEATVVSDMTDEELVSAIEFSLSSK